MAAKSESKPKGKPRGKGRPIQKGQVLNPTGRPKKTQAERDLIEACKDHCNEALETILQVMRNGETEKNRLTAAETVIERAYGRPVQPSDVNLSGGVAFTWQS